MKTVLFVCVENSSRSQMAEAFARIHGHDLIQVESAGSRPAKVVNPGATIAMSERGYDLSKHRPKSLTDISPGPWDYVITMGCGDTCPFVATKKRLQWELPDPKGFSPMEYRTIRDDIEQRVLELLSQIRKKTSESLEKK